MNKILCALILLVGLLVSGCTQTKVVETPVVVEKTIYITPIEAQMKLITAEIRILNYGVIRNKSFIIDKRNETISTGQFFTYTNQEKGINLRTYYNIPYLFLSPPIHINCSEKIYEKDYSAKIDIQYLLKIDSTYSEIISLYYPKIPLVIKNENGSCRFEYDENHYESKVVDSRFWPDYLVEDINKELKEVVDKKLCCDE